MMDYDYTHHSLLQYYQYSYFYLFLIFQVQKNVSTQNKQLDSDNALFCRNGPFSTIFFICLVLFIHLVQFKKRVLKPTRRSFAFYLLGYLSLVITPSVFFFNVYFLVSFFFCFIFCKLCG